ncbi:hypothetical protein BC834DRAFT_841061 [Gloeopeniophorella convolvens]|nr:hypothetical protein BC834DRAFT_841061 [Gloeopeniophorella convolvens]
MSGLASNIRELLGHTPSSNQLAVHLAALSLHVSSSPVATPEVKSYTDAVYFNYYALGLSLLFVPVNGYRPPSGASRQNLQEENLVLDGIDIYNNVTADKSDSTQSSLRSRSPTYSPYPITPFVIAISAEPKDGNPRPPTLDITRKTVGKDFVAALGEPDRKGGGSGPSSGSIGIWMEWTRDGLMVELGGDDSRGPQAWERGKDASWLIISVFLPKNK